MWVASGVQRLVDQLVIAAVQDARSEQQPGAVVKRLRMVDGCLATHLVGLGHTTGQALPRVAVVEGGAVAVLTRMTCSPVKGLPSAAPAKTTGSATCSPSHR